MKILIVDVDPFGKVGGGQTVYRNIVLRNPKAQFWYLSQGPQQRGIAPSNAHPVAFNRVFLPQFHPASAEDELHYSAFLAARNVAHAVRGLNFDIVDVPDYYDFPAYLKPAFQEFGVHCGKLAVSLHGRMSETQFINWNVAEQVDPTADASRSLWSLHPAKRLKQQLETMGLRSADLRYGISSWYINYLRGFLGGLPAYYVHPLQILEIPSARPLDNGARPEIICAGRLERTKGPDLFVDLAWLSGAGDFGDVSLIGADETCGGTSVSQLMQARAAQRGVSLKHISQVPREDLLRRFESPCAVVAPSRFETFGLVPLEGILRGAVAGFSRNSGLCEFVRNELPLLRRVEIRSENLQGAATDLRALLMDFKRARVENIEYLRSLELDQRFAPSAIENFMLDAYAADEAFCSRTRDEIEYRYHLEIGVRRFVSFPRVHTPYREFVLRRLGTRGVRWAKEIRDVARATLSWQNLRPRRVTRRWAKKFAMARLPAVYAMFKEAQASLAVASLRGSSDPFEAVKIVASACRMGRTQHFHTLAVGEAKRGNVLLKHLYLQRLNRWMGSSKSFNCRLASHAYQEQGYQDVAAVLPYLCASDDPGRDTEVYRYLTDRARAFPMRRKSDHALRIVRLGDARPRVSVLVSLYDAQDKLDHFIEMLARADLVRSRQAEVIFVDSGSPTLQFTSERIRRLAEQMDFVFLRSKRRETIAAAWNRGLAEARGEYIACLGADEMVTCDGLGKLANYLDEHPRIDWVSANAVLCKVDRHGRMLNSPLTYNRNGLTEFSPILDPTYLTYVGGMYRRAIHDRVGVYDPSFRAASDTEFKHRAFPSIKFAHLDKTLGVFLDYPEQRVTSHPRAEAEDLRAIYLFRTPGGLRYLLQNKSSEEVFNLLRQSLAFRRCYSQTEDTDFDLSESLVTYLTKMDPGSVLYRQLREDVAYLRGLTREIDAWSGDRQSYLRINRSAVRLYRLERKHAAQLDTKPHYHIFNDVRYAVHSNVWSLEEHSF